MVATCGGVFFGVAIWVALTRRPRLARSCSSLFRYASVASIVAGIALPVAAAVYGYPTSVVLFGAAAAARDRSTCIAGNLRRLRAGTEHRFRLSGDRRVRKALLLLAVARRLRSGRARRRRTRRRLVRRRGDESATDRPDIVTGAADARGRRRSRPTRPTRSRADAEQARRRHRVDATRGGRAGPDPDAAHRQRRSSRPATCADISFVRSPLTGGLATPARPPRSALVGIALGRSRLAHRLQEVPRLLRRAFRRGRRLRDRRRRLRLGAVVRGRLAERLPGRADGPASATHELLHAFGALPLGAPNACTATADPAGRRHRAPVRLAARRPLPVRRPARRSRASCSTSTTTTTTRTAGRGTTSRTRLAASLGHAGRGSRSSRSPAPGTRDERPARRRLPRRPARRSGIRERS